MKTIILKSKNNQIELPEDCMRVIAVFKANGRLLSNDDFLGSMRVNFLGEYLMDERYYIKGNSILFTKREYSAIWMVRIIERLMELISPKRYEVKYNEL